MAHISYRNSAISRILDDHIPSSGSGYSNAVSATSDAVPHNAYGQTSVPASLYGTGTTPFSNDIKAMRVITEHHDIRGSIIDTCNCALNAGMITGIIEHDYWTKNRIKMPVIIKIINTDIESPDFLKSTCASVSEFVQTLSQSEIYIPPTLHKYLGQPDNVNIVIVNDDPDNYPNLGDTVVLQSDSPHLCTDEEVHNQLQTQLSKSFIIGVGYKFSLYHESACEIIEITISKIFDEFNRKVPNAIVNNRDISVVWDL